MELSEAEVEALAAVLAPRFATWASREAVARSAGLGDAQVTGDAATAWRLLVKQAMKRGRLRQLIDEAAQAAVGDPVLDRLAEGARAGKLVLPEEKETSPALLGAVGVVLALGALALGAWAIGLIGGGSVEEPTVAVSAVAEAEAAQAEPEAPAPPPRRAAAVVEPEEGEGDEGDEGDEEGEAEGEGDDEAEPAEGAPADVDYEGPCPAVSQGLLGYAFVGERPPEVSLGVWTLTRDVHVRADYPNAANGWDAQTRSVCVAPRGARVRLGGDPIAVEGGAWWAPVRAVRAR